MGRSVSTPTGALVTYRTIDLENEDNDSGNFNFEFEFLVDDLLYQAQQAWPSMEETDKWIGREDQAILENGHAYFGLSEYCGLVAVWLLPKDEDHPELSEAWTSRQEDKLMEMGTCYRVGTFSNGESIYERRTQ